MTHKQMGHPAPLPTYYRVIYYKLIATRINYLKFNLIRCTVIHIGGGKNSSAVDRLFH